MTLLVLHPPAVTDQPRTMPQPGGSLPPTTCQGFFSRFCLHQPHNQSSILHPMKVSILKWWPQGKNSTIWRKKPGCLLIDTKAIGTNIKLLAIINGLKCLTYLISTSEELFCFVLNQQPQRFPFALPGSFTERQEGHPEEGLG